MPNRTALVVLTIALCAAVALGANPFGICTPTGTPDIPMSTLDVATEIVSPRTQEPPGLVPVIVKLTNLGDVPALVPRLDVNIQPSEYMDYRENIAISVGSNQAVTLNYWVYTGGNETCVAWITYPADTNHANDTDVVIVSTTGIQGWVELEPNAGTDLTLLPSPLAGDVLHIGYSLNQVGPASLTLFDASGRVVKTYDFVGTRTGALLLDLRLLNDGVYIVRLDDGRSALTRKLVVQR